MEEKIAREIEIINRILGCIKYWFGLPPVGEPERRPGRCISWWFEIWIDVASVAIINLGKGTERAWWLDYTEKTKRIIIKKKKILYNPTHTFPFLHYEQKIYTRKRTTATNSSLKQYTNAAKIISVSVHPCAPPLWQHRHRERHPGGEHLGTIALLGLCKKP